MLTDLDCNTSCGRPEHQKQVPHIPQPMEEKPLTGQNRFPRVGKFASGRRRRCRQTPGSQRRASHCPSILHPLQSSGVSLYLLAASALQVDRSAARRLGCAGAASQAHGGSSSELTAAPSRNFGCSMCNVCALLPW